MELIILWSDIVLSKCTMSGLELALDILVAQEWYEKAALVRDEINRRLIRSNHKQIVIVTSRFE